MDQVCQQHSDDVDVYVGRVRASFEQIPIAALVTVVNAALMSALLFRTEPAWGVYAWFGTAVLASTARMTLWWMHRHTTPTDAQYRMWSLANGSGTLGAGLVWGVGSILLLPEAEIDQLFWVFLIGGMCAGAASLHYPHLPTAVAFIIPAGLPLAIRFALDGSARLGTAAVMIVAFLAALVATSRRANRFFGETLRLRVEMTRRTRELDAANAKLREEIAERHAAEASLRHVHQMEAVGQLTGAIAHDFNNLLTAVLGSLALLRKCLPADDRRAERFLHIAVQGAEKGAVLTQRLLAFGRRQTLMPEVLDVATLLHGMSGLLNTSTGVNVRVAMRFPRNLPPVEVDANQLELAVLNLPVNARDAMPGGGEITISAREATASGYDQDRLPAGRYVVLSVADNGQGMDKATLNRATEPFFTTKDVGKGTGLGLLDGPWLCRTVGRTTRSAKRAGYRHHSRTLAARGGDGRRSCRAAAGTAAAHGPSLWKRARGR